MALTEVGTKGIKDASIKLEDFENGTTGDAGKFLKNVDGGAPEWSTVDTSTIPVADEGTDTECFPVFTTAAVGDEAPKTNANLKYNSNTGYFTAALFASTNVGGNGFRWLGPGSTSSGTDAGYLDGNGVFLSGNVNGPCSIRFCGNTHNDYVGFSSIGSSLPSGTQLVWKLPTADGTNGQALTTNGSAQLSWEKTSSPEVYGFNASSGNLIVTTTNGGADNISASDYAAFEDQFFAATGFSFSINASGNLIATI